jgi:hypothetical protein
MKEWSCLMQARFCLTLTLTLTLCFVFCVSCVEPIGVLCRSLQLGLTVVLIQYDLQERDKSTMSHGRLLQGPMSTCVSGIKRGSPQVTVATVTCGPELLKSQLRLKQLGECSLSFCTLSDWDVAWFSRGGPQGGT